MQNEYNKTLSNHKNIQNNYKKMCTANEKNWGLVARNGIRLYHISYHNILTKGEVSQGMMKNVEIQKH